MNSATLRSLRLGGGFISPTNRSRFRIIGSDRTRYLNSQVSNDLRKATSNTALPCCLLTPKGKISAFVWAFEHEDAWILDADSAVRDGLQSRLDRYIVADDVQVEDISESGSLLHIFGQAAIDSQFAGGVHNCRLGFPGIDLWIPQNQIDSFYRKLIDLKILEATPDLYEPLRIAQGIPMWGREISEDTFPAEAGLDRSAVDFFKGCYVGQEVVSRIQSVGRVNRCLSGFTAKNAGTNLRPGSKILDSDSKSPVGILTSTAYHFELSRTIALGYLKTGSAVPQKDFFLAVDPENGEELPIQPHLLPINVP